MSFSPLCPAVPPPRFSLTVPGRQVDLVVRHQDLRRQDPVEQGERGDRLAGAVHVGAGLQQPKLAAMVAQPRQFAVELALGAEGRTGRAGDRIDEPEAGVVPRALVLGADVAEADDQPDRAAGVGGHQKKARRCRHRRARS
jgi:hypothetical protein